MQMMSCAIVEAVRGRPDARDDVIVIAHPLQGNLPESGRLDIIAQCAHIDKAYLCRGRVARQTETQSSGGTG
jgi:hypothetical protein